MYNYSFAVSQSRKIIHSNKIHILSFFLGWQKKCDIFI